MKNLIVILALLFPVLALAEPSIEFQTEKHDFGCVRQGELPEFHFEFINTGTDVLNIENINTS